MKKIKLIVNKILIAFIIAIIISFISINKIKAYNYGNKVSELLGLTLVANDEFNHESYDYAQLLNKVQQIAQTDSIYVAESPNADVIIARAYDNYNSEYAQFSNGEYLFVGRIEIEFYESTILIRLVNVNGYGNIYEISREENGLLVDDTISELLFDNFINGGSSISIWNSADDEEITSEELNTLIYDLLTNKLFYVQTSTNIKSDIKYNVNTTNIDSFYNSNGWKNYIDFVKNNDFVFTENNQRLCFTNLFGDAVVENVNLNITYNALCLAEQSIKSGLYYYNSSENEYYNANSTQLILDSSFRINASIADNPLDYQLCALPSAILNRLSQDIARYLLTETVKPSYDVQLIYRTQYNFSDGSNEYIIEYGKYKQDETITLTQDALNNILKTEKISVVGVPSNYIMNGWSYDNILSNSYTIKINSSNYQIEVYDNYLEAYTINLKIKINEKVTWQGQISTYSNIFNSVISWSNLDSPFIEIEDIFTSNIALISDKYGRPPQLNDRLLTLTQQPYADNNSIVLFKIETDKGTYGFNPNEQTKSINLYDLLESEGIQNYLDVNHNNYKIDISMKWAEDTPTNIETKDWEEISGIFNQVADTIQRFLDIKIVFITVGQILILVLSISILGFIIKIWQGGNNG